ncbi:MAG: MurR/RpiR family transcriptional regulator [Aerococcus sp.]|nr:MurR/RpiR family transcriptional regulator [Aerococcus sp.]
MERLTKTEEYLWNYINQHLNEVATQSIVELSVSANVSTATIVRTMKKVGYDGYTAFKHSLKNKNKGWDFAELEVADQSIKRAIEKNEQETLYTIRQINPSLIEDAVQKLFAADRVILFARGLSTYVAEEFSLKLRVLNKYCENYNDPNIIRIKSESLTPEDVAVFISLNGETKDLVEAIENCRKADVTTIVFTTQKESSLARQATILFCGYKAPDSVIPEYEVKSRLPLSILTRIISDAYGIRVNVH